MSSGGRPELVLLSGGRGGEVGGTPARGALRLVRVGPPADDLQAALEETVAAARRVRREIEERIACALDDLLRLRAPVNPPG